MQLRSALLVCDSLRDARTAAAAEGFDIDRPNSMQVRLGPPRYVSVAGEWDTFRLRD